MSGSDHLRRAALLAIGSLTTLPWLVNLCDWVFDCGCRSLWNGADALCNVHDPSNHDCPWCATGALGFVLPSLLILIVQAAIAWWPGRLDLRSAVVRLLLMALAFGIVGSVVGLGFGLASGYWK